MPGLPAALHSTCPSVGKGQGQSSCIRCPRSSRGQSFWEVVEEDLTSGRGALIQIDEVTWLRGLRKPETVGNRLPISQPSVLSGIIEHIDHLFICCVWRYVAPKMPQGKDLDWSALGYTLGTSKLSDILFSFTIHDQVLFNYWSEFQSD